MLSKQSPSKSVVPAAEIPALLPSLLGLKDPESLPPLVGTRLPVLGLKDPESLSPLVGAMVPLKLRNGGAAR